MWQPKIWVLLPNSDMWRLAMETASSSVTSRTVPSGISELKGSPKLVWMNLLKYEALATL